MIKVAVIGAGYLGRYHAQKYYNMDGVRLTHVVDTNEERADECAFTFGAAPYYDYRQIIDYVDAVSVVTPTSTHFQIVGDLLQSGVHVMVEKPIADDLRKALILSSLAQGRNLVLQVGHIEMFNPVFDALSVDIVQGTTMYQADRLCQYSGRCIDVDVVLDLMIHDINLIHTFVRDIKVDDIRAYGVSVFSSGVDIAKAWITYENGVIAVLTASRLSPYDSRTMSLCKPGVVTVLDFAAPAISVEERDTCVLKRGYTSVKPVDKLRKELESFIDCVVKDRKPFVDGWKASKALATALEISNIIGKHDEPRSERCVLSNV